MNNMKVLFSFILLSVILIFGISSGSTVFAQVTVIPDTGSGSSTDDCVDVEYGCFVPGTATVDLGGKVIFSNTDSAAHTWSAGSAADGPTGEFDTSVVMAGNSYEWTADVVGEIPYFCMVHPWMDGMIIVQEAGAEEVNDEVMMVTVEEEGMVVSVEEGFKLAGMGKTILIEVSGAKQTVTFEIIASDGEIIETLSFVASNQGDINLPLIFPKDTEPGTYTIYVKDAFDSDCVRFDIDTFVVDRDCTSGPIPEPTPIISEPIKDKNSEWITHLKAENKKLKIENHHLSAENKKLKTEKLQSSDNIDNDSSSIIKKLKSKIQKQSSDIESLQNIITDQISVIIEVLENINKR